MSTVVCDLCSAYVDSDRDAEALGDESVVCMSCRQLEPPICSACNGSGEGMHEGNRCASCGGRGVEALRFEGRGPDPDVEFDRRRDEKMEESYARRKS